MSDHQMNWSTVPDDTVREVYRLAETCLEGTVTLALAADQKATTLSGMFGGAAVALLAAAAALLASTTINWALTLAALVAAAFLLAAAVACTLAARPTDFYVGGYEPKYTVPVAKDEMWLVRYTIEDLQRRIDANRAVLERGARWTTKGLWLAGMSVAAGVIPLLAI